MNPIPPIDRTCASVHSNDDCTMHLKSTKFTIPCVDPILWPISARIRQNLIAILDRPSLHMDIFTILVHRNSILSGDICLSRSRFTSRHIYWSVWIAKAICELSKTPSNTCSHSVSVHCYNRFLPFKMQISLR